ncbi:MULTISPECIES: hypothetical protein [Alphaproteobacteria]
MSLDRIRSVRFSEDEENLILRAIRLCGSAGFSTYCREVTVRSAMAVLNPLCLPILRALSDLQRDINRAIETAQRIYLRSADNNSEHASQELDGALKAIKVMQRELERTIHDLLEMKKS